MISCASVRPTWYVLPKRSVSANKRRTSASWLSGSAASTSWQILSASPGSFSNRYRIAFSRAAGTASLESGLSSINGSSFPPKLSQEFAERIIEFIHHPFFQRNDRVVGNGDALRADVG